MRAIRTLPGLLLASFFLQAATASERPTSDPYTGNLSIFEYPERDGRLQINRVMDLLKIKSGTHVADIGAGSGWFTVRAARRVGPRGSVFAVEINPDYVYYIKQRAMRETLPNIRAILGQPDNPLLPHKSVDAVLLLKTYHEVAHPIALLKSLRASLRPGARLGIIDRNGNGTDHGLNAVVVTDEATRAGFRLREKYDFVKADGMDYFLIFTAADAATASP